MPEALGPIGLCAAQEQAIFQCTSGMRVIAICADSAPAQGYVQYRYGQPGNIELQHPAAPQGSGTLAYATTAYSGGGEAQISFSRGRYTYVVYSRTVRTGFGPEGNAPEFSAGVTVLRDGTPIVRKSCDRPETARLDVAAAQHRLPEADFIEHQ
ncbi:hypothetical protein [Stakelama tenebrarum]|uniref:Uncharacterized protein n=1 Tax=Stakelama tenebrarum TaxID=2711215 RepID=A0A6G6Y689_9SPHN|nr:hypothetical protein [Sphingosinithalassobacter tenebrarum]QIG80464.1 hypothetical protein G5C33_12195 [Sphingosinithalassobacter tenebrarum]